MLSVVIPLYNEEENVAPLCAEIASALAGRAYEIVLVDDKSTDQTLQSIPNQPEIRVLELARNTGQSGAMYAGIHAAKGEVLVLMDGDRQNDPADIPKMLETLERGFDMVCGYRASRKDTLSKRLTSRVANTIRSRFTKDGVRDTGCTLKVLRRECREALLPFNGMHRYLPAIFLQAGLKIGEVPVNHRGRMAGASKYTNWDRALRGIYDLIGVQWLLRRKVQWNAQEGGAKVP